MKKRLRKKKHLHDFKEWGVPVAIKITEGTSFDGFLDDFIEQAIESNGCYFGGGGKDAHLEGFIELGKTFDRPEERLRRIVAWLDTRADVEKYIIGKLIDVWYGAFDELVKRDIHK